MLIILGLIMMSKEVSIINAIIAIKQMKEINC